MVLDVPLKHGNHWLSDTLWQPRRQKSFNEPLWKPQNLHSVMYLCLEVNLLLWLLLLCIENSEKFQINSDVHNLKTSHKYNLHTQSSIDTKYQKGVYYIGIKLLNNLSSTIKSLNSWSRSIQACNKRISLISLFLLC